MLDFKAINKVPSNLELIDICLNKTQRKTPTVVHPTYQISKIRAFYTRKIIFSGKEFIDRLNTITSQFPRLESIHPFYSNLFNILYDRDHYKMALGHVSSTKNSIDRISKEYVRLVKYAESAYRAKQLKRAALGKMVTIAKKLGKSMEYLEEVRQNLSRLPIIDPTTRTLLLCGYPNVGKSSFMNKISRANTNVDSYAFTTKNLYVGHFDYKYLKWQIIDTPGILYNLNIEERNLIEMQTITAMAHIQSTVVYMMDVSRQCGYTIKEQIGLCQSMEPIMGDFLVCISKCDLLDITNKIPEGKNLKENHLIAEGKKLESENSKNINAIAEGKNLENINLIAEGDNFENNKISDEGNNLEKNNLIADNFNHLDLEDRILLVDFLKNRKFIFMSCKDDINIEKVRNLACEMLLSKRLEDKVNNEKMDDFLNRINIIKPTNYNPREIGTIIDDTIVTEREKRDALGDAYVFDDKKNYLCENKYDTIPEFFEGKNISDFLNLDTLKCFEEMKEKEKTMDYDKKYEIFTKEEREYVETVHIRKKQREIISNEKGRCQIPTKWIENRKKCERPIVVKESNCAIMPYVFKKGTFKKIPNPRYFDAKPKHIYRSKSKHGDKSRR